MASHSINGHEDEISIESTPTLENPQPHKALPTILETPTLEIHPPEEDLEDAEESNVSAQVQVEDDEEEEEAYVAQELDRTVVQAEEEQPAAAPQEAPSTDSEGGDDETGSQMTEVDLDKDNRATSKEPEHELPPPTPPPRDPPANVTPIIITDRESIQSPPPTSSPSRVPSGSHPRKGSVTSFNAARGNPVSVVLISSALEIIIASKEAKKSQQLKESAHNALEMIRAGMGGDRPREVFEPLRLACETKNEKLVVASLDCIQKLISYSFFVETVPPAQAMASASPPGSPTTAASSAGGHTTSLADLLTNTITSAYTESTSDAVSLQIVKALLALMLSTTILVHHSSLLKAVRTVYNVFLLSQDPVNQMVAQGGLTQMVNHVFSRAKVIKNANGSDSPADVISDLQARLSREGVVFPRKKGSTSPGTPTQITLPNPSNPTPPPLMPSTNGEAAHTSPDVSVSAPSEAGDESRSVTSTDAPADISFSSSVGEEQQVAESLANSDTAVSSVDGQNSARNTPQRELSQSPFVGNGSRSSLPPPPPPKQITTNDLFIKDAFLVFRALCKLTMKPLNTESERDLKSHAMRSKLLSLQLVLAIVDQHLPILVDSNAIIYSSSSDEQTAFLQAVKQYLCLSLSRNAVSTVPQVFEISVEIFWRVISGMRTKLKKEIEVLLNEIFLPILEMRNSTARQKSVLLSMLYRLSQDPQALVEIYLNYDCDRDAVENIYEKLMTILSKLATTHFSKGPEVQPATKDTPGQPNGQKHNSAQLGPAFPPSANSTALGGAQAADSPAHAMPGFSEPKLKRQSLEALVAVLRSLVVWGAGTTAGTAGPGMGPSTAPSTTAASSGRNSVVNGGNMGMGVQAHASSDDLRSEGDQSANGVTPASAPADVNGFSVGNGSGVAAGLPMSTSAPDLIDDPGKFETAKQRKTTLLEGIRKFNFKPKRGIQFLLETGFISSRDPADIARFLLETDGLSKAMIGEYLGEGDDENVAIMHAFVDQLEFTDLAFVDALRVFLQSFRLPGEAQKIDRYMLKFAERYIAGNPSTIFANADTAYVLAYSVIMLNTDTYNPQVKNRMSKADFLKNNRGINDGADLPADYLDSIYDNIYAQEIRMKDEIEAAVLQSIAPGTGLAGALANVGRDLQKEAYVMQSTGMANKTEALFKTMMRAQRKGKSTEQFFSASHAVHVRPMFEVAWMSFLAGISVPLQDTDDLEVVDLCLDGFKNAIRIVCVFDLELERNAFVTTLAKFTFLNNLGEMKIKNMEAIKALLDVAVTDGNHLKGSWHEVLTCVSQLERMQLISNGIDVPDGGRRSSGNARGAPSRMKKALPTEDLANESRSTHITVAADMVFSLSHYLNGTAIVDFVRALSHVSWEEIQSSGLSDHPRLFSLQKLVDISYYNMSRIRLEWSNMWVFLGEHFNQVCCHSNPHVAFFAMDALRQLAMRFLEKEELAHFKFQKDFLKPFEYAMIHNPNPDVRDMILQCLQQMIQLRVQNMRSGWRTMFGVFSAASKVLTEKIATSAFDIVQKLNKDHFADIVRNGSFADLTVCITDFCKVSKYQKISLSAIGMLRGVVPVMLNLPETHLATPMSPTGEANGAPPVDDPMIKFWFPVLFSFYDIIMNGEDLEVRRLALDALFSTLKEHGATYRPDFWDTVCQELLFPIFAVLRSSQDMSRFTTQEDMSVWLSTTMIQALRNLIDLYTFYFDILERLLDGLLDLLCVCICQENDTLARIGTSCFQQLLEKNVKKLSPARWEKVVKTFIRLFKTTTPHQLFDESLRAEFENAQPQSPKEEPQSSGIVPAPLSPSHHGPRQDTLNDRRRIFKQIIVKCVLQLLLIETTNDLLHNEDVYNTIPPEHLLQLMRVLDHSYQFARSFNADKELRTGLWKVGFMKHLPNLLKQESSSAATLVNILLKMYYDPRPSHTPLKPEVAERLIPLGLGVIQDFITLRGDTQTKNIAAWTPVVAQILIGFCGFDNQAFARYLPAIYPLATELLGRDLSPEVREAVRRVFVKVGQSQGITD